MFSVNGETELTPWANSACSTEWQAPVRGTRCWRASMCYPSIHFNFRHLFNILIELYLRLWNVVLDWGRGILI